MKQGLERKQEGVSINMPYTIRMDGIDATLPLKLYLDFVNFYNDESNREGGVIDGGKLFSRFPVVGRVMTYSSYLTQYPLEEIPKDIFESITGIEEAEELFKRAYDSVTTKKEVYSFNLEMPMGQVGKIEIAPVDGGDANYDEFEIHLKAAILRDILKPINFAAFKYVGYKVTENLDRQRDSLDPTGDYNDWNIIYSSYSNKFSLTDIFEEDLREITYGQVFFASKIAIEKAIKVMEASLEEIDSDILNLLNINLEFIKVNVPEDHTRKNDQLLSSFHRGVNTSKLSSDMIFTILKLENGNYKDFAQNLAVLFNMNSAYLPQNMEKLRITQQTAAMRDLYSSLLESDNFTHVTVTYGCPFKGNLINWLLVEVKRALFNINSA